MNTYVARVTAVDADTGLLTIARGSGPDGAEGVLDQVPCHFPERVRQGDSVLIVDLGGAQAALAHFRNDATGTGEPPLQQAGPVTRSDTAPPVGQGWETVQVTATRRGIGGAVESFVQDAPALRFGSVLTGATDPAAGQGWMPATVWVREGLPGFFQVYVKTGDPI